MQQVRSARSALMLAFHFAALNLTHWLTWVSVVSGLAVAGLVFVGAGQLLRRRSRAALFASDDDIPWESLLDLVKERYDAEKGGKDVESLNPDELMQELLAEIPRLQRSRSPWQTAEEADYLP